MNRLKGKTVFVIHGMSDEMPFCCGVHSSSKLATAKLKQIWNETRTALGEDDDYELLKLSDDTLMYRRYDSYVTIQVGMCIIS